MTLTWTEAEFAMTSGGNEMGIRLTTTSLEKEEEEEEEEAVGVRTEEIV